APRAGGERRIREAYLSPGISHMSRTVSYTPPLASHVCLAVVLLPPGPGSQVLSELLYVPPAAVHSLCVLILAEPEHAASGRASRATMAVVNNIFLEHIVTSCWLMDVSLFWAETPTAPPRPTPPVSPAATGGDPAATLSGRGEKLAVLWGLAARRHHAPTPEQRSRGEKEIPAGAFTPRRVGS